MGESRELITKNVHILTSSAKANIPRDVVRLSLKEADEKRETRWFEEQLGAADVGIFVGAGSVVWRRRARRVVGRCRDWCCPAMACRGGHGQGRRHVGAKLPPDEEKRRPGVLGELHRRHA